MTLDSWIESTGPKNVAKKLRVDPSTVSQWRRGLAFPRPKHLVQIHELSGKKVGYADMIHHFLKQQR